MLHIARRHMRTTGDFLQNSMLEVLQEEGIEVVVLSEQATKFGSIETLADARACADLFGAHGDEIDGVMVTLPNFGDERAVANALRFAGLNVR